MTHQIINFYKFVEIAAPQDLRDELAAEAKRLGLLGTVLIAKEGLNGALSGERPNLDAMIQYLKQRPGFADLPVRFSTGEAQPFRRLLVRVKPWIIRFAEAADPQVGEITRGARLSPSELQALLAKKTGDVVLVDTRNDYETEHGRFAGAELLPIRAFTEFPAAFQERFGEAKDKTFIFYCTGGIRCEKVVPWATAAGYPHAYQLDGGILRYFEECGSGEFQGDCFVFDGRSLIGGRLSETDNDQSGIRLQPKRKPQADPRRAGA